MLLTGATAIVLAVAGCSSGGGETITVHVDKATFIAKANAICQQGYERTEVRYKDFVKHAGEDAFSDYREIRDYADTVLIPEKQRELKELRALGTPPGDEQKVEAILAAYEEGIETAEASPRNAVSSTAGVFVRATELAQAYGLERCRY